MPMPKKDTVQKSIRIPKSLEDKLDTILRDPVTGRTMFGGLSHIAVEGIERLLKSHDWKNKLNQLRARGPDYQMDIEVRETFGGSNGPMDALTLDFFAEKEAGFPGDNEQPEEPGGYRIVEVLLGDLSVIDKFPELQRAAERELNKRGNEDEK